MIDRRQHERFKINGKAFVYYETHAPKIAEITDISTDGAAFYHVGNAETVNQAFCVEIILPDSTRFMEKLPCRTVSDCKIDNGTDEGLGRRRCSVQFSDLTEQQRAKIACFIHDYCWRIPN